MIDRFGREINYLRLSVTENCNLRCRYCMPEQGACEPGNEQMLTEGGLCKPRHEQRLTEGGLCEAMHEQMLTEGSLCDQPHKQLPTKRRLRGPLNEQMLTEEEMLCAVRAAASIGVRKVRITGGEPLLRPDILSICRHVAEVEGIRETVLTTNATLLSGLARPLREAGIRRVNISLDTLNPEKYAYITRRGKLADALRGIESALTAGFEKIKLNVVLIGGFNDDEIPALAELTLRWPADVRFIELMPMPGETIFNEQAYIPAARVLEMLPDAVPAEFASKILPGTVPAALTTEIRPETVPAEFASKILPQTAPAEIAPETQPAASTSTDINGVAQLYRLPGALGNIGLISPLTQNFCKGCNRLRLTADGRLKPCLHSREEISIKGLNEEEMAEAMRQAILKKPMQHGPLSCDERSQTTRQMNRIGG